MVGSISMTYLLAMAVILRFVLCLGWQLPSSSYKKAAFEMAAGDLAEDCANAPALVNAHPDYYAAYNLLGLCATKQGEIKKAESFFRKSLELNPEFIDARINLAVNLAGQGRNQAAILQLKDLLRVDPRNVTALYNLGQIEHLRGDYKQATEHLRLANALAPGDTQVSMALANSLIQSGQVGPAQELIARTIETQSDRRVLIAVGLLALRANMEEMAQRSLEKAVRLEPKDVGQVLKLARIATDQKAYKVVHALLNVTEESGKDSAEWNALQGYAEYKLDNPAKALEHMRRAIELNPKAEEYYLKIAELMLFYKSQEPAIAYLEAGLKELPDSAILQYALGVCYMAGRVDQKAARMHLEAALKLQPDFWSALAALAMLFKNAKDLTGLRDTADRLIQLNPQSYEGYYYKALALQQDSTTGIQDADDEQAQQLLEKSIRLGPNFADSHVALGRLFAKRGNIPKAIAQFERGIDLNPESAEPYYYLGMAFRKVGEKERAAQAFSQFQELRAKEPQGNLVMFQIAR